MCLSFRSHPESYYICGWLISISIREAIFTLPADGSRIPDVYIYIYIDR